MKYIRIKHSGNAGDTIYSLSSAHFLALTQKTKVVYCLKINVPSTFTSLTHPVGNVMLNEDMANRLKPLLLGQDYIHDVEIAEDFEDIDYDFDAFRVNAKNLSAGDIKLWNSLRYPEIKPSTTYKVLESGSLKEDYIVLARSTRYNNPLIDYTILESLGRKIYFVGVEQEFKIMSAIMPSLEFKQFDDFSELADFINSSYLFIGNQSMPFAIAEQLKTNRILEQYFGCPNVIPQGGDWSIFQTQEEFKNIIESWQKLQKVKSVE